jgi:hypothetical protein
MTRLLSCGRTHQGHVHTATWLTGEPENCTSAAAIFPKQARRSPIVSADGAIPSSEAPYSEAVLDEGRPLDRRWRWAE